MFNSAYKRSLQLHEKFESQSKKKSIVFISFHKCATSFFSKNVLKDIRNYNHIDYLQEMYGKPDSFYPLIVDEGFIYGVIRLQDKEHPRYEFVRNLIKKTNEVKTIFWVRDPRDILVSMYYSFGFSHGISSEKGVAAYQENRKADIQKVTIDEYVLREVMRIENKFNYMRSLMAINNEYILLKYEDMIHNYDTFYNEFSGFIGGEINMYHDLYDNTRPRKSEDINSHKRSGMVGGYRDKLKPETIECLNNCLTDVLQNFGYVK